MRKMGWIGLLSVLILFGISRSAFCWETKNSKFSFGAVPPIFAQILDSDTVKRIMDNAAAQGGPPLVTFYDKDKVFQMRVVICLIGGVAILGFICLVCYLHKIQKELEKKNKKTAEEKVIEEPQTTRVRIICPACQKTYHVSSAFIGKNIGKKARCKRCNNVFSIDKVSLGQA